MTIRFTCAGCGSLLKIKDELAGTDGKCPKCKLEFVVPDPSSDDDSAELEVTVNTAAAQDSEAEESEPKLIEPPSKSEKSEKSSGDRLPEPPKEKVAAKAIAKSRKQSGDDFDPAAFLMDDKPRRPMAAFEDPGDRDEERMGGARVENRPKRTTKPPSSAEIPVSGVSASAHAKEMMMKAMEDSRLHAAELPPEEEKPGFDWSGFMREVGLKWGGGAIFGLILCYGMYLMFDSMMGSKMKLPPLATVTGTVTLNGSPLPGATVYFAPLDATIPDAKKERARTSMGFTDEKGQYTMTYLGNTKGVAVGKCRVWLDLVTEKGQVIPPDHTEATMTVREVLAGRNQPFNFDMKTP